MITKQAIVEDLFHSFSEIRYVAAYTHGNLLYQQGAQVIDNSICLSKSSDLSGLPDKILNHLQTE